MEEDKNYNGAEGNLTKAIELVPDSAKYYLERSFLRVKLYEDNSIVEADLTEAIHVEPNYYKAYLARGLSKAYRREWKGAIDDCSKAIKCYEYAQKAHYFRARFRIYMLFESFRQRNIPLNSVAELQQYREFNEIVRLAVPDLTFEINHNPTLLEALYLRGFLTNNTEEQRRALDLGLDPSLMK